MLKFQYLQDGSPAQDLPLRGVYLLGTDGNAMRCDVRVDKGMILIEKRETGSAAFALLHRVGDIGEITLQTCVLPERDEPYLLSLELARHRLMVLFSKLEDWQMFDLGPDHPVTKRAEKARKLFVEALCFQGTDPVKSQEFAEQCLAVALDGSEELALAHSDMLVQRRKASPTLSRHIIGCGVALDDAHERLRVGLAANVDYLALPVPWKVLAPEEGDYHWSRMDGWADWAAQSRTAVLAGPLISFGGENLPDWLYIWEHDYDTIRDMAYEHIERVVGRYRNAVVAWNVVAGLHVNSHFSFNFEQLMDLTRTGLMLVKKLQPQARAIVEIHQPFGEYYSYNQRSIPPMMYADLVVQSGVPFDGFSIKLPMGQARPGQYTRDLMQLSNILDEYGGFGKPIYLTLAAPSEPVTQMMIADTESDQPVDDHAGFWRRPWSPVVQGHWLEATFQIAASKPYVEGVAWQQLLDNADIELPLSGLIGEELRPKPAYRRWTAFRRNLLTDSGQAPAEMPPPASDEAELDLMPRKQLHPDPDAPHETEPTSAPSASTDSSDSSKDTL